MILGTQRENIEDNKRDGKILRGGQIGNSKLAEDDVETILRIYAAWPKNPKTGKPRNGVLVHLARQFDVTRQLVWQIVHGKWWVHVKQRVDADMEAKKND